MEWVAGKGLVSSANWVVERQAWALSPPCGVQWDTWGWAAGVQLSSLLEPGQGGHEPHGGLAPAGQ